MAKKKVKKQALVPELRFPEFRGDGEWSEIPLANLSTRLRRKVGSKKLTPVSITAGQGFVDQTAKFGRRIAGDQYRNYIHIRRGDFVYNKGNSKTFAQGCIYQLKEFEEAAASTAFICFKLHEECVDHYFQSLFECNTHGRKLRKFITSGARSDGLLNINPTDFFSIELPVPPRKAEQQKIADCLGSLDDLIAAHSAKLDALQDHKKGLLQQLFPADGQTKPILRFPEFEDAAEWNETTMSRCLSKVIDYRGKAPPKSDLGVPLITAKNVRFGHLDMSIAEFIDEEQYHSWMSKGLPQDGDVLFTTEAPLANVALFPSKGIYALGQRLLTLRTHEEKCRHDFFFQLLLSPRMQKEIEHRSTGSTAKGIKSSVFIKLEILLPSTAEQQKIADCLSALDTLIGAQAKEIAALKEHKKGLMQQLFPNPELCKA